VSTPTKVRVPYEFCYGSFQGRVDFGADSFCIFYLSLPVITEKRERKRERERERERKREREI
jgi:hypothetical protein